MSETSYKVAELCAGYGGLAAGLELAGIGHTVEWFAETDEYAAAVFTHHHSDAPNLGDLTQITDPPEVDIITAGFPCQPVSLAGSRKGTTDERWLIQDVCRVARLSQARWLILENVSGLLTANDGDAMAHVCQAMAHNGYRRWAWTTVRASDVGAPHQRNRWFCIAAADTDATGLERPTRQGIQERGPRPARNSEMAFVDTDDIGRERARGTRGRRERPQNNNPPTADTDGGPVRDQPIGQSGGCDTAQPRPNQQTPTDTDSGTSRRRANIQKREQERRTVTFGNSARFGDYAPAIERWEHITGRSAPEPGVDGRLNPKFVEFMMGLLDGYVTGHVNRTQALRILGNGVVPLQAAAAVRMLT